MMNKYILVKILSVVISAFSQVVLKISAGKEHKNRLMEYLNPHVIISYGVFFVCTVLGTYSLKGISLTLSSLLNALSYILIPVLSWFILKEKLNRRQLIGTLIIIAGLVIYSL